MRRRPKLKEVFVRLEDHLECVCTSQHHAVENSEAETGKSDPSKVTRHHRPMITPSVQALHRCSHLCIIMHHHAFCPPSIRLIVPLSLCLPPRLCTGRPFFSHDCSQTDRHTCEVACYCKTAEPVCFCAVFGENVCVCMSAHESICESVY